MTEFVTKEIAERCARRFFGKKVSARKKYSDGNIWIVKCGYISLEFWASYGDYQYFDYPFATVCVCDDSTKIIVVFEEDKIVSRLEDELHHEQIILP